MVKNLPANTEDARGTGLIPGWGRSPGGGNGNLLQYSCLGSQSHGQRSLVGYSPWGHKQSDMTEHACMMKSQLVTKINEENCFSNKTQSLMKKTPQQ